MSDRSFAVDLAVLLVVIASAVGTLYGLGALYVLSYDEVPGEITDRKVVETEEGEYLALIHVEHDGVSQWVSLGTYDRRTVAVNAAHGTGQPIDLTWQDRTAAALTPVSAALVVLSARQLPGPQEGADD